MSVVLSTVGTRHTLTVQLRAARNAAAPHRNCDDRRALRKFKSFKRRRNADKSPRSRAVRDTAARTKQKKHASPSRQRRNWERVLQLRAKKKQQRRQQHNNGSGEMVVTPAPRSVDTSAVDSGLEDLQDWSTTDMSLDEYFRRTEGNWLRFEDQD